VELHELTNTPESDRNLSWENSFFQALSQENISLINTDPQYGPDGWPYLFAKTETNSAESAQKVLRWLSERGLGLVLNPDKPLPDFVFSYGMIWHFRETGYFYLPKDKNPKQESVSFTRNEIKLSGQPSVSFLPKYVRKILREFLQQQGVLTPKILMVSFDGENFDLAFSIDSLGNPPENEFKGICEAISWFLPTHYSLLLTKEEGLPEFEVL
jgi:hypothetical protein